MKAVFFDIDGTLWDSKNQIPESTRIAIRKLRENGHLTFINTGRTKGFVNNPDLLSLGFDGIVSGCGTMIEYKDEIIFLHEISPELGISAMNTVKEYGFLPILEGKEYLYMNRSDFENDPYGQKLIRELGDRLLSIDDNFGKWEMSKFSCVTESSDQAAAFAELSSDFDILEHNPAIAEFVPKGYSKGSGILKICELLNIDISDTIAIGDSVNDLDMFSVAGTSVAMGNGNDIAKKAADFVTTPLMEDGIYNAMVHLGLIS